MVVDKIYVNNATRLTLSDRFTILLSVQPGLPPRRTRNQNPFDDGQTSTFRRGSMKNRLGLTPMARAAMEIKKVPLKQRIGKIRPRAPKSQSLFRNGAPLMSPGRGRGRGRGAQRRTSYPSITRGRRRSNSVGNLNRSSSFSDVSSGAESEVYDRPLTVRRRGRGGFRFNGQTRNSRVQRWKNGRGEGQGRGRGRGRGSNRGNGNRGGKSVPSREDLDRELDQYMAGTRAHLDQELDSYMGDAMDTSN